MILYATHKGGRYLPLDKSLQEEPEGKRNLYINITNRCNCACTFCLRSLKKMPTGDSLWLTSEPTVAEIKSELKNAPWEKISEVVFCGFGEPTMRLNVLLEISRYLKENFPEHPIRLNTNGLAEFEYGRNVSLEFARLIDTVSISLNAANAEDYLKLTRAKYGLKSYEALLSFAEHCRQYLPNVILTIVNHVTSAKDIQLCQEICKKRGLKLRVRPYETT